MKRDETDLQRALGRLLTAIQSEEMRALGTPWWSDTHAALRRAEELYWAAKHGRLEVAMGARSPRDYLGQDWLSRHPRILPALQDLESHLQDFARQA